MSYSKDEILNKVAAAFRFVGEDSDFRKHAGEDVFSMVFEIEDLNARNLVSIENGHIYWGTNIPNHYDLQVTWKRWEYLDSWSQSWLPLWWYRVLRRVSVEGKQLPALQECLYLFRNYLRLMMREDQNGQR